MIACIFINYFRKDTQETTNTGHPRGKTTKGDAGRGIPQHKCFYTL